MKIIFPDNFVGFFPCFFLAVSKQFSCDAILPICHYLNISQKSIQLMCSLFIKNMFFRLLWINKHEILHPCMPMLVINYWQLPKNRDFEIESHNRLSARQKKYVGNLIAELSFASALPVYLAMIAHFLCVFFTNTTHKEVLDTQGYDVRTWLEDSLNVIVRHP